MKCDIYANGELIGWAEFANFDPGMGVASAPFVPNDDYAKYQLVFRETTVVYDGADVARIEQSKEAWLKAQGFNLTSRTADGEILEPQNGVCISDFSGELEDDAIEIYLLGLPRETSEKYFQEAIRQYYGENA